MQFETIQDRKLKDDLDRVFGNRETAKDMRQAVFMARKGLINDESIAAYVRYKEEERKAYLEVMTEENPDYAFKTGDDLLSLDNINDVVSEPERSSSPAAAKCGDGEYGRDQDALPEH